MSFWGELKRRNVFKVGAAYVIVAWLVVQVANTFFPILHLPEWIVTLVAFLLILGLPVALILAWAYEMTPEGVKLSKKVPLADSITHVTGRKLNYVLGGLLVVAVTLLILDHYYFDRRVVEHEVVSTFAEQAPPSVEEKEEPKTIAVLPFEDLSPEKDQEYFVDGLIEELLNSLAQIPDLNVTGRTSSFSFKGSNKTVQEIANVLGVENVLEGSVRKAGNNLRITAQLLRGADGFHLWSKTYDKEYKVEEMFSVQEDIATAVANELKLTLGVGKSTKQLGSTDDLNAYELFLVAKGKYNIQERTEALETVDAAISLDPNFALAWALKAEIHNDTSTWVASDLAASERDAAEQAALKAIKIEPDLADGYFPLGVIKQSNGNWIDAEKLFRDGMRRTPVAINPEEYGMPQRYWAVGQLTKTYDLLEAARLTDPLNMKVRLFYLWSFGFLGDIQGLEEEYERVKELLGSQWQWWENIMFAARICAGEILSHDMMIESLGTDPPLSEAKEHLGSPEETLAWLRQIFTENDGLSSADFCFISLYAAYFGDPELSMDSLKKGVSIEAQGIFWAWAPVFQEVRQLPRFKEFIREIGLVDYWNEFGWPDLCHPTDDGDFVCD